MSSNTLITNNFRLHTARQVFESFSEEANTIYYMFQGRHLPFPVDAKPPRSQDSTFGTLVEPYDNMIGGRQITPNDVRLMIRKNMWVSGSVYQPYTDFTPNLFNSNFFICVKNGVQYDVFKCLSNNRNSPSTAAPSRLQTSADDDFYLTSDGYQWKWMYSIDENTFEKFNTSEYIPVVPSADVSGNAVSGAIDVINVVSPGTRYNSYANGTIQESAVGGNSQIFTIEAASASNNDFYSTCAIKITNGPGAGQIRKVVDYFVAGSTKRIVVDFPFNTLPTTNSSYEITPLVTILGDGQGATARALINATSNSISSVEVVSRGTGYTWATAIITANTGIVNAVSNSVITPNTAVVVAVMSPPGGHGFDPAAELGSHSIGLSVNFDAALSDNRLLEVNDFRQFGVIKDIQFANLVFNISETSSGGFDDEEVVIQEGTGASGVVIAANSSVLRLSNTTGFFFSGNSTFRLLRGQTSNTTAVVDSVQGPALYYDSTTKVVVDNVVGTFSLDEKIVQGEFANAHIHSVTRVGNTATYVIRLTNVRGIFNITDDANDVDQTITGLTSGATASVTEVFNGDIVRGSGSILYLENIQPVAKANAQSETIKLVLDF